jgi:hypothetical protein
MDTPLSDTETTTTVYSFTTKTTSALSAEIETVQKIRFCGSPQEWGYYTHHSGLVSSVLVRNIAEVKHILVNAPESVFTWDVAKIEFDVEWYDEVF